MRKMKKVVALVIITALTVGMISGCGKKEQENIDVVALADQLKSEIKFKDNLTEVDDELFYETYLIDEKSVVNKKAYLSAATTAEEIVVIEATDEAKTKEIKEAFITRIDEQKESFKTYLPEEMKKLNDVYLEIKGKYVILCISDDNAKAKEIVG